MKKKLALLYMKQSYNKMPQNPVIIKINFKKL